mgnify:FL=1
MHSNGCSLYTTGSGIRKMNDQQQLLLSWQLNITAQERPPGRAAAPRDGAPIHHRIFQLKPIPLNSDSGLRAYFTVMVICFE